LKRQTSLIEKNIVPHAEFEAAENRHLQAQARLAVAESQLQSASNQLLDAELKLSYTQVAASWPNEDSANENLDDFRYVGTRLVNEGQLVAPNSPLFDIVSLNPLLVEVDVIEKDYPKIHVGMEATISTEAFPTETFKGKVLRIAPVLSSDSRQARLELLVDNQDLKLKPGMYANVVFVFNEHENVWSVDVDTPFRKQDGYIIFVADKSTGTVKMINVELGLVENGMVELVGVPSIDGPVVVLGQHLLQDGQLFKVAGESDSSASPKM
jgi:multidrug efflux pump subunit AcrA (membrane-fusion protein)